MSKTEGIKVFKEFAIDVFEAVLEDDCFNENFSKERFLRMKLTLSERRPWKSMA
jgi:hypothetical protein